MNTDRDGHKKMDSKIVFVISISNTAHLI